MLPWKKPQKTGAGERRGSWKGREWHRTGGELLWRDSLYLGLILTPPPAAKPPPYTNRAFLSPFDTNNIAESWLSLGTEQHSTHRRHIGSICLRVLENSYVYNHQQTAHITDWHKQPSTSFLQYHCCGMQMESAWLACQCSFGAIFPNMNAGDLNKLRLFCSLLTKESRKTIISISWGLQSVARSSGSAENLLRAGTFYFPIECIQSTRCHEVRAAHSNLRPVSITAIPYISLQSIAVGRALARCHTFKRNHSQGRKSKKAQEILSIPDRKR